MLDDISEVERRTLDTIKAKQLNAAELWDRSADAFDGASARLLVLADVIRDPSLGDLSEAFVEAGAAILAAGDAVKAAETALQAVMAEIGPANGGTVQ